jgi:hypothetical protein
MRLPELLSRLDAKRVGGGWQARCPAHDDRTPSLSLGEGDDGRILLKCHAGCAAGQIVAALGLEMHDLFIDDDGHLPAIIATYDYVDENGTVLYQVVRFAPKDFRQRRPDGAGGWVWRLDGTRRVLYRLPRVRQAIAAMKRVFIVEGEKDVHAVEAKGYVATTNPGGAGKWRTEYSDMLRDADVVIVADRDQPGYAHARRIAKSIMDVASSVVLVEPAVGKDVSDHLEAGMTLADLLPIPIDEGGTHDYNDRTDQREAPQGASVVNVVSVVGRFGNWPDPLDPSALTGFLGEFVREIAPHSEADPAALAVQFLVGFGSVLGRGPYFRVEADHHHLNEFALMVGATAKGRKGTSWGYARRVLEATDPTWTWRSGLSSGEGVIWHVRDEITKKGKKGQTLVVDPGVSDKRLLLVESEFASAVRVMAREGNTLSPVLRLAWDGATKLETLTKNSPARATNAHISIIGHITADELLTIDRTELVNGFLNRFMLVCVTRSKVLPEGGSLPDSTIGLMAETLRTIIDRARRVGEIARTDDARARWREIYPDLSAGRPGLFGAIVSRAEAHVMRLACLYALLDESAVITRTHLEGALALWRYCEASAEFLFGSRLGDPDAERLLAELRRARQLDRTQIRDLFSRNKSADDVNRLLAMLMARGLATKTTETTEGRPREVWRVLE